MLKKVVVAAGGSLALVAQVFFSGHAEATNFGASAGASFYQDWYIPAYYDNLTSRTAQQSTWVRGWSINESPYFGAYSPGSTSHAGAEMHIQDYPINGYGTAICNPSSTPAGGVCPDGHVVINDSALLADSDTWHLRSVICSEIGHTLGLNHGSTPGSCMWDPNSAYYGPTSGVSPGDPGDHDYAGLRSRYGA